MAVRLTEVAGMGPMFRAAATLSLVPVHDFPTNAHVSSTKSVLTV